MRREPAFRIFSAEFNDSFTEIKSAGEMSPSYVVTPIGGKINRLLVTGVLTDVENISENGEFVRAHLSDPTGVFTIYSGQYQKEVTQQLQNIEVPSFVAILGKSKTYSPEEGEMYVSIRPEKIFEVSAETRNKWIVETCIRTKERIEAIVEAMKMDDPNASELTKLGYSNDLSEGILLALKNYENVDVKKYLSIIKESLQYINPSNEPLHDYHKNEKENEKLDDLEEPVKEEPSDKNEAASSEEIEDEILQTIKKLEGEDGASWDLIVEKCKKDGIDENSIEEALTSLMDKGFIFEPILGTIKTT